MLEEQHHVAGRSKILDFGSELLQAFVLKNVCVFLAHVACVFGRIPGYSLQFLPPTQAASEQ